MTKQAFGRKQGRRLGITVLYLESDLLAALREMQNRQNRKMKRMDEEDED